MPRHALIWAVLTLVAWPTLTLARCEAVGVLTVVHDRYQTIIQEKGDTRARAAARLYPYLARINARKLSHDLNMDIDRERMERVLNAAQKLAEYVVSGVTLSFVGLAPHSQNVDWLGNVVRDSDCPTTPAATAQAARLLASGGIESPDQDTDSRSDHPEPSIGDPRSLLTALLILAIVLLAAILIFLIKSRSLRIRRVKRLPRFTVGFPLSLTFADDTGNDQTLTVTAVDLSLGGMKIAWSDAAPDKTPLTLILPIGEVLASVIWSNAHYAGILFDRNISQDDLQVLRDQ